MVGIALIAGALPLVACLPAPLTDWPNHIARVFIGVRLLRGDAFWSQYYTLNARPVPNEALDLGIGLLNVAGVNVDIAAMLFLLFTYAVFIAGFVALARAFGARGASKPLLGATLFLTGPLMYGLVNYMLGLGAAMGLAGLWSAGGARRRWLLALFATPVLFLVHLMGAAVWVALIACLEAPTWLTAIRGGWRDLDIRAAARGASCIGAGLVLTTLVLTSAAGAESVPHADGSNIYYISNDSLFHLALAKLTNVPRMFSDHARVPTIVGTGLAIIGIFSCLRLGARWKMQPGAWLAGVALLVAALILPDSAGPGSLLDYRLTLVPMLVAAAAIDITWRHGNYRRAAFVLLLLLLVGRSAAFAADFAAEQSVFADVDAAARALPRDSILLVAQGRAVSEISHDDWWSPPAEHLGSRAVYESVFVPTVFALASQQPVVLRPAFAVWRRGWIITSEADFAAMTRDIEPLCRTADSRFAAVALFVAYPGQFISRSVPRRSVIANKQRFVVIDVCRPSGFLEPTAWSAVD